MGTEVAMSGGGSGLFRDVLEGSFPELYAAPEEAEPEALPLEGEGGGDGGDAAPPPAEEGAGKDAEDGEGVEGEGGEGGAGEPAEPDEYQQRIADIENQVRARTHAGFGAFGISTRTQPGRRPR